MMDASHKTQGNIARLFSEVLPPTPASCFSFYAHLNQGLGGGTLVLNMDTDLSGGSSYQNLVSLTNPSSPDWVFVQVRAYNHISSSLSYSFCTICYLLIP